MVEGRSPGVDIGQPDRPAGNDCIDVRRPRTADSRVIESRYYGSASYGMSGRNRSFFKRNEGGRSTKLLKQVVICCIILIMAVGLKNTDFPFAEGLKSGVRYLLTTETDFSPLFHRVVRIAGQWTNVDWPLLDPEISGNPKPVISKVPDGIGPGLPLGGKVLKPYGWLQDKEKEILEFHRGVDIKAEEGEIVEAVRTGKVVKVYVDGTGLGSVIIRHDEKRMTQYTNLCNIPVREGEKVERGKAIGEIETTKGEPTHLHFEVLYYGKPVDPLSVMTTF